MAVKSILTGQLLVSDSAVQGQNKIAKALDSKITGLTNYQHVNVSLPKLTLNQSVNLNFSNIKMLYMKSKKTSDGSDLQIRINVTVNDTSVSLNDVPCSEIILFNTDIAAVSLDNDTVSDAEVEIIIAG